MKGELRYCPHCCQNVFTVSGIDHTALAILLLAGIFPGLIYYAVYEERMHCPICMTPDKYLEPPERPQRPTPELMAIEELRMDFDQLLRR